MVGKGLSSLNPLLPRTHMQLITAKINESLRNKHPKQLHYAVFNYNLKNTEKPWVIEQFI